MIEVETPDEELELDEEDVDEAEELDLAGFRE
jgi:hypothetical protein